MKTEPNAPIVPMKHANGQQMGHDAETTHFLECTNAYIGLTKREYIVARTMQGFISSCDWKFEAANLDHAKETARLAVIYADALIVELNKQTK